MKRFRQFISVLIAAMAFTVGAMGLASASTLFLPRDHLVIDLNFGVEWLRCSVGQTWNGETCTGEIVKLNHDAIVDAIRLANEQLGGEWRLPNLDELE